MVAAYVDDNHDDDDDVRSLAVQLIKADKSRVKRSDNIADTDARRAGRSGRSGRREVEVVAAEEESGGGAGERRFRSAWTRRRGAARWLEGREREGGPR